MNIKELRGAFRDLSAKGAQQVLDLIAGKLDPATFKSVQDWVKGCYNVPDKSEQIMKALDELIGGYGVEGITPEGQTYPVADYVNTGDTYSATIVRDIENDEYILTTWGDWLEKWEADHQPEESEPSEPGEDDITANDPGGPFFYNRKQIAGNREELKAWMEAEGYFPNVFWISDHGNAHLIKDL